MPKPVVRDDMPKRIQRLGRLLKLIEPIPASWAERDTQLQPTKKKKGGMALVECSDYRLMINKWRRALRWTEGLDHALSVMLASVTSTKSVGDQLWIKVIGPASCGKSTLCEALSVNDQYTLAKSTIRGFHSGFGDGEEDNSLIAKLFDKTLITKDGDTLLQSPNLGQILSEARDLYDSVSRTHYRNRTSRDYSGVRMTWILCGTSSLRSIDSSELGERFLDCVIMDGIDDELEDDILWRVANRADRNLSIESNGCAEKHYEPALVEAFQLTGGYVSYLRENATQLLSEVRNPEEALRLCTRLGKFVAYMRARPSGMQEETAEREFGARLVVQMVRLAKCLAVVLNKRSVDIEVMNRVSQVAFDTARGNTYNISYALYEATEGHTTKALSLHVTLSDSKLRELLRFLQRIGAIKLVQRKQAGVSKRSWHLTPLLRKLFEDVH